MPRLNLEEVYCTHICVSCVAQHDSMIPDFGPLTNARSRIQERAYDFLAFSSNAFRVTIRFHEWTYCKAMQAYSLWFLDGTAAVACKPSALRKPASRNSSFTALALATNAAKQQQTSLLCIQHFLSLWRF